MSVFQRPAKPPKIRFRISRPLASRSSRAGIVTETVSGSTAIAQRRGFSKLIDRLEAGDVLIVTKLDRLGRDAIDVSTTRK